MEENIRLANSGPLVSIIIPVYNAEKYLAETIESALSQTWDNKEIIVIDDGSTDGSLSVAESFAGKGVRVFTQKNAGASAARNHGIKEARGTFIQFLDADDLLSPGKISNQLSRLPDQEHLALCAIAYFFDDQELSSVKAGQEWFKTGSDDPPDFLVKLYGGGLIGEGYGGMITPHSWLTPVALIAKAGLWNEALTVDDDGEFFCRVVLASKGIVYDDKGIAYYRKYPVARSLSSRKDYASSKSALLAAELKTNALLQHTDDLNARIALGRIFDELAFGFYPVHSDLYAIAARRGKELGNRGITYYPHGIKLFLSKLFGWKAVRILEELTRKYLKNSEETAGTPAHKAK